MSAFQYCVMAYWRGFSRENRRNRPFFEINLRRSIHQSPVQRARPFAISNRFSSNPPHSWWWFSINQMEKSSDSLPCTIYCAPRQAWLTKRCNLGESTPPDEWHFCRHYGEE